LLAWSATWSLGRGAHNAAAVARTEFIAHLRLCAALNADYNAAELIFGELVANAVTHARERAIVRLWFDDWAHLSVRDDSGSFGQRPIAPAPAHVESGRGLYIVKALARELNIEGTDAGWIVTAQLPVQCKSERLDLRDVS